MLKSLSRKSAYLLFIGFALFVGFCNARAGTKEVTLILENTSVSPIDLSYEIYRKDDKGGKHHYIKDNINQLNPRAKYYTTIPNLSTKHTPIAEITKVSMDNKIVISPSCAKSISKSNHLQIQITFEDAYVPTVNCNYIN